MQLTKLEHSCLLIEHAGKTVLADPGNYSWDYLERELAAIKALDLVVITHNHADHYDSDFVAALAAKFPAASVAAPAAMRPVLAGCGVEILTSPPVFLQPFPAAHAALPWAVPPPQNQGYHLWDRLTLPGDSLQLKAACPTLALPLQAPWGSPREAFACALKLKPKRILPIHDYHWRPRYRESFYAQAREFFAGHGIEFLTPENGRPLSLG